MTGNQYGLHINHGKRGTKEYHAWMNMIARCLRPNHTSYPRYGGRGITVCKRWRVFTNFLADMGPSPADMTLERINNSKGYKPGNCRWASPKDQARNTRRNIFVQVNGVQMTLTDAANHHGLKPNTVISRKRHGVPIEAWFLPCQPEAQA